MTTTIARPTRQTSRAGWLVPVGLILLTLIPIIAGAARVSELSGAPAITADNARFVTSPIPVIVHIVGATLFSILGAFQFVPGLRRRNRWHRLAGRVLIPAGVAVALSGIWMAVLSEHAPADGVALSALRVIFATLMLAFIGLGVRAIIRRDFVSHGAWMTRAYAIAVAAGTQAIVLIPQTIIFGKYEETSRAVFMGAAWVINLAIAELVIRRRAARRTVARAS